MKKVLTLILLLTGVWMMLAFIATKPKNRYLITNYGAKGDSVTINTQAIQKTIDECMARGGGIVVVPKGIFSSGAIFLKKGVDLLIEKGGVLKGSTNPDDYPQINTRWEGEERLWTSAFINIIDQQGTSISGEGTIDGSGDVWTKIGRQQYLANKSLPHFGRPRLICFQNCKNVSITGLKLHNQAVWCLHILYSANVSVRGLQITANHDIPSSDGIDVDSSDGVHITQTFIDVNDDCISIKSGKDDDGRRVNRPCQNVLIDSCHFAYGHGGVAMGSEVTGGINNITVKHCLVDGNNWAPIRFKSQPSRGGVIEKITFQDITLDHTKKAFEFNMSWRMVGTVREPVKVPTILRNILIEKVSGSVKSVGDMSGLSNSPIDGVKFVDCNIEAETGLQLRNVVNLDTVGLHLKVQSGRTVF